jgi:hypothetical protein
MPSPWMPRGLTRSSMAERLSLRVSRKTAMLSSVPMTASRSTNGARILAGSGSSQRTPM